MKKFLLVFFSVLIAGCLLLGALIFVRFPQAPVKGPKVRYKVIEGLIEVFSVQDNEVRGLLGFVKPGRALIAPTLPPEKEEVPFWLQWLEPVTTVAVERANLFMYQESKKSRYRQFAVGYTDESIQRGFTKEIERSRVLSGVRMSFAPDGFSISARVGSVPVVVKGCASTGGTVDRLFLNLRWVKIGEVFLPKHILRSIENIFAKAYVASSHHSIRLLRIQFGDKKIIMYYQKEADNASGDSQMADARSSPEIFYPSGD